MKAMILAAGRGERMRPLTDTTPKPLIEVAGRPLIEHHVAALKSAGITDFVVNLGWLGERLRAHLGDGARLGVRIAYSEEGWPAMETGGGVFQALPLLGPEPFLLANGDVYADLDWAALVARAGAQPPRELAHLVLVPNPAHNRRGDFGLAADRVVIDSAERHTYSGLAILRPELFAEARGGAFPLAPLLRAAIERRQVGGELFQGRWSDVGTPERLALLEQELGA